MTSWEFTQEVIHFPRTNDEHKTFPTNASTPKYKKCKIKINISSNPMIYLYFSIILG